MGFIDDNEMVRVDIFKPSGKWYTTLSVRWSIYNREVEWDLHKILRLSIGEDNCRRYEGMYAVCLEPYHELAHPQMIKL